VTKILKVHDKAATTIIELGQTLIDAKEALDQHGQWMIVFEQNELPFSLSLAERHMKIARDRKLKSASVQNLPSAVSTLYELSKLSDDDFHQAMAEGKIHPGTTRKEAAALGGKIQPDPEPKRPKPPLVTIILIEIEDNIAELIHKVPQESIDNDARKRARSLGEQLIVWSKAKLPSMH
jgi:hypothetical protein